MTPLLLALVPAVAIRLITDQEHIRVRNAWLLAVVGLAAAAVWPTAPWLTPILLWFVFRWRGIDQLPSLVTWAAIGATWYFVQAMPAWAWTLVPYVWLIVGVWHVVVLLWQYDPELIPGRDDIDGSRYHRPAPAWLDRLTAGAVSKRSARPFGLFGSAPTTALFLALIVPFAPLWLLPVYVTGIWLTGSWLALSAASLGLAVSSSGPLTVLVATVLILLGVAILAALRHEGETHIADQRTRAYPLKRWVNAVSPHGASLDGVRLRVNVHRVLWAVARQSPWRVNLMGRGPNTLDMELRRRSFVTGLTLPESDAFSEWLAGLWDMGVFAAAAIVLFAWQAWPHLRLGDPWTAAWVVSAVLCCGHNPLRTMPVGIQMLAIGARVALGGA